MNKGSELSHVWVLRGRTWICHVFSYNLIFNTVHKGRSLDEFPSKIDHTI